MPPLDAVAAAVGAAAPWAAPKWVWAFCWRAHARLLPALHARDGLTNTCVNLQVLWLKALAGDDAAYALLPRGARLLVAPPLRRFYPRLHHQNINPREVPGRRRPGRAAPRRRRRGRRGAGGGLRRARGPRGGRPRPRARAADVDLPEVIAQKRGVLGHADGYGAELIACDLAGAGVEAALARRSRTHARHIRRRGAPDLPRRRGGGGSSTRAAARRAPRCRSASRTGSRSTASTRRQPRASSRTAALTSSATSRSRASRGTWVSRGGGRANVVFVSSSFYVVVCLKEGSSSPRAGVGFSQTYVRQRRTPPARYTGWAHASRGLAA